jgi:hypothetical protein
VIAALWSSEVLHALRLRNQTFRVLCPDAGEAFEAWWRGQPGTVANSTVLIVLDPLAVGRQRQYVGLDAALSVRPRYRDYADAVGRLIGAAR